MNFGLLFGQGAAGLQRYAKSAYGVDMTLAEAEQARDAFFSTYPALRQWQNNTAETAKRDGCVKTPAGRIRDFSQESSGYRTTEALNTPIQGGVASVRAKLLDWPERPGWHLR